MSIVNPITNATTVGSSTIYFSVWMSGAEDFEVARPKNFPNNYTDYTLGSGMKAQMNNGVSKSEDQEVTQPVETTVQTTTFADNVGKQDMSREVPSIKTDAVLGTDPYPDQGLRQILSRPYPVATFTWSGTDGIGTPYPWITFPDALFSIPNIQEKLQRFQYMRAGIRISVRINGTAFHYGKLLLSWIPHWNPSDSTTRPFQNMYTSSTLNGSILSANTNVALEWLIPFTGPSNYWNLKDDSSAAAEGFMGIVQPWVMHPLSLTGATATPELTVTIYANFVEPEVAGLGLRTSSAIVFKKKNIPNKKQAYLGRMFPQMSSPTEVTDMVACFMNPFPTIVQASTCIPVDISMGEKVESFSELLHRYSEWVYAQTTHPANFDPWSPGVGDMSMWGLINRNFLFKRGSYRIKVWTIQASKDVNFNIQGWNYTTDEVVTDLHYAAVGTAMVNSNNTNILEFQVPFYTSYNMKGPDGFAMEQELFPQFAVGYSSLDITWSGLEYNLYIAAGDDFTLGWPLNPVSILKPSSVKETGGKLPLNAIFQKEIEKQSGELSNSNSSVRSRVRRV